MPIYEFRCLECEEVFELLLMKAGEEKEMECPKCGAKSFEKVMSSTNYYMGASQGPSGKNTGVSKQERTCSTGSCSTYTIAGHE